jgi:nitrogen-specific signal transduction histidine kinase
MDVQQARDASEPSEFCLAIEEYCHQLQAGGDAAPEMIWTLGPEGQYHYLKSSLPELRGGTEQRERGSARPQGAQPEDLYQCIASYEKAFAARQPFHLEFRARRADGSFASIIAHGVPQYGLDERFAGYVGLFQEANPEDFKLGQWQATAECSRSVRQALCRIAVSLQQSSPLISRERAKSRKAMAPISVKALLDCLDNSLTPMIIVDKQGCAVYCNNAFRTFCANALPVARTEGASKVTRWPDDSQFLSSVRKVCSPAKDCAPEVHAWLDSDLFAHDPDVRISGQPLAVAGRELTAFWIIDTSQEKRTRLLEQAFLHDLVNAAGGIQMLIDLLTEGPSPHERAEYIKLIQIGLNRLLSEIDNKKMMLDNSEPSTSVCNVHEVLKSLAVYYRSHPIGRNCRIEIDEDSVHAMNVRSNQTLLVRTLDNMLRRALEGSGQGGTITLGCRQINGDLELWVQIPNVNSEKVRTRIFNPSSSIACDEDAGAQVAKLLSELCARRVAVSSDQKGGITLSVRYPADPEIVPQRKRYRAKQAS